jgi:Tfp pilus assembly protein PilF
MSDYNEAIELDSHNYLVYVNRARVLQNMGDNEGARSDIEKALLEGLPRENADQLRRELDLGKG